MSKKIEGLQKRNPLPHFSPKRLGQKEPLAGSRLRFTPANPLELQGYRPPQSTPDYETMKVAGLGGRIEYLPKAVALEMLRNGDLCYALNKKTGREYILMKEAYDEYEQARDIYEHQHITALKEIGMRLKESPEVRLKRELFFRIEEKVLAKSSPQNMRHLSFIIQEAAENGGDYIAAIALLLHNVERSIAAKLLKPSRGISPVLDKIINDILGTIDRFRELNEITYSPPEKGNSVQDDNDALLKIARSDWRAVVMLLAHKLSSISMQPKDANDISSRSIRELYGPLARRFGLKNLDSKLRNEEFRFSDETRFTQIEAGIVQALWMSRVEAEIYLTDLEQKFVLAFAASSGKYSFSFSGVKTPQSVAEKLKYKKEAYPEIFMMTDLLRATVVTEEAISLKEAKAAAQLALGDEFARFDEKQTETKKHKEGKETVQVHHVIIVLKKGNSLELQVLDKRSYELTERGTHAHWIYKIENITGQKVDDTLIKLCAKHTNGELAHDIKMTYEALLQWTYVYLKKGEYQYALRTMNGSLPIDIFRRIKREDRIKGEDLKDYGGATIRKAWKKKGAKDADEAQPVSDGDLIEFKPRNEQHQKELVKMNLQPVYADTRVALFNLTQKE